MSLRRQVAKMERKSSFKNCQTWWSSVTVCSKKDTNEQRLGLKTFPRDQTGPFIAGFAYRDVGKLGRVRVQPLPAPTPEGQTSGSRPEVAVRLQIPDSLTTRVAGAWQEDTTQRKRGICSQLLDVAQGLRKAGHRQWLNTTTWHATRK